MNNIIWNSDRPNLFYRKNCDDNIQSTTTLTDYGRQKKRVFSVNHRSSGVSTIEGQEGLQEEEVAEERERTKVSRA